MAVKFGKDGTLYCNSVKYNYKQARNIIADGCYGNISDAWNFSNANYSNALNGYKSYRCFEFLAGTTAMLTQQAPTPIAGHKYYGGCMFSSPYGFSTNDARLEWFLTDGDNNVNLTFAQKNIATGDVWLKLSSIVEAGQAPQQGQWIIRSFVVNGSSACYCSRFILIDLTDTFGVGNEPTKEWCDNNIREWETIINYGCISNNVSKSNINTRYSIIGATQIGPFNYLTLDSRWEPREYLYLLKGMSENVEGHVYSGSAFALDNTKKYYSYIEYHKPYLDEIPNQSIDFYFPEAEPVLGNALIVNNKNFNGGGGMWEWKRASCINDRESFASGTYNMRIDFNNDKETNEMRLTAINLLDVNSSVTVYNRDRISGTNVITLNDVNKEWCDRWIDGRSSPIIHIKDPNNKNIKFNANYDVVCNDIEIRPELNAIKFDKETGTIYCKKLVKNVSY